MTNALDIYMAELPKYNFLKPEEELSIFSKEDLSDNDVTRIIESHLKLVIYWAKKYYQTGECELEELIAEGNLGLVIAVKRFNRKKNTKFSSYSSFWIRAKIRQFLSSKNRTIQVNTSLFHKYHKILKISKDYERANGSTPPLNYLSNQTGFSPQVIRKIFRSCVTQHIHLDTVARESEGELQGKIDLKDFIRDEFILTSSEQIQEKESIEVMLKQVQSLNEQERDIINRTSGINNYGKQTYCEVGKIHDISGERVRQIRELSLTKLKKRITSKL